jgi:prepilin peptidase CpaA
MFDLTTSQIVFLAAVVIYTLAASYTDLKYRKIPNKLTAPMCVAGFIYQFLFFGTSGLLNGLLGFVAGFGILFVLWMIGSAGGGDVKLLGGLSVWLGASLTLRVLLCSMIFVIIGTTGLLAYSLLSKGMSRTRQQLMSKKPPAKSADDPTTARQKRRVMAFAVPVALATWCVLALFRTQW